MYIIITRVENSFITWKDFLMSSFYSHTLLHFLPLSNHWPVIRHYHFFLRLSFYWFHAACHLLKLASLTQHHAFEIHLSCCVLNSWFLLLEQIILFVGIILYSNIWLYGSFTVCLSINPLRDSWIGLRDPTIETFSWALNRWKNLDQW